MTAPAETPDASKATPEALRVEYEQVNENFRMLADIRFKLLALVPALGGAANFVLSGFALSKGAAAPPPSLVLMIGVMGFLATLGITIYDLRNSELYGKLISRAKYLEEILKLPANGQFRERPPRDHYLFGLLTIGHDVGLSIIYGPVLGAWAFPVTYVVHTSLQTRMNVVGDSRVVALVVALLMGVAFTVELLRHDGSLPWLKYIQEGELVEASDLKEGTLVLRYSVRDVHSTLKGEMTDAWKEKVKQWIAENPKDRRSGKMLEVTYRKKRTKNKVIDVKFPADGKDNKQPS